MTRIIIACVILASTLAITNEVEAQRRTPFRNLVGGVGKGLGVGWGAGNHWRNPGYDPGYYHPYSQYAEYSSYGYHHHSPTSTTYIQQPQMMSPTPANQLQSPNDGGTGSDVSQPAVPSINSSGMRIRSLVPGSYRRPTNRSQSVVDQNEINQHLRPFHSLRSPNAVELPHGGQFVRPQVPASSTDWDLEMETTPRQAPNYAPRR